jgi:hypothetical protein
MLVTAAEVSGPQDAELDVCTDDIGGATVRHGRLRNALSYFFLSF